MVISLRVTETAVVCNSVCKSIFLCGKNDFTNIEAPPEGLRQESDKREMSFENQQVALI